MAAILDRFSEPTRAWFTSAFRGPTSAQQQAWATIAAGSHTLVIAPTGSGKTLAAFLWAIDRLIDGRGNAGNGGVSSGNVSAGDENGENHHDAGRTEPTDEPAPRTRVLYVSPLKALAVDIERNLRTPLAGISEQAARRGADAPDVTVGVRSGDSTTAERRRLVRAPPDILITTPESLYLMLTSSAARTLTGVETVIVDEVHAVAGTKRGAHLALSLERLDMRLPRPCRRIGLSATARPHGEVARFLGGAQPVEIVAPEAPKRWALTVQVPVEDMSAPPAADPDASPSIWPHLENRIADLIEQNRSTIVFANSRRLAERLTARLVELHAERAGREVDRDEAPPALLGSPTEVAYGHRTAQDRDRPVFALAHHGSVSKDRRARIEQDLKSGNLRCVVATSSLELGIDMGAVDLVIQVGAPPSVASGLQRIGRAGHHVGDVSTGVLVPKHRADLLHCAVTADRMRAGAIEELSVIANPLDVLAQQTVAAVAADDEALGVHHWFAAVRRSAPFASLSHSVFEATLDMLAGRYPSDEFADLRPRIVRDHRNGTLTARRGAAQLAVTSGGTIPDRGAFTVHTAGDKAARVGELDEEMVYESRVGDVFALGTSSWRITEITHDRVVVTPAAGRTGRLPFWHGDGPGRPAEFGAAIGAFTRRVADGTDAGHAPTGTDAADLAAPLARCGLNGYAAANLLSLVRDQRNAAGAVPTDTTLVVERFRDELGDWRLILHSPFGRRVHAPWALAVGARLREDAGVDANPVAFDDGIVLRLPEAGGPAPGGELFHFAAAEVERIVTDALGGSALFASRFRECAARALLLPRRRPGKRAPLWQQRHRAAQLLDVVRRHPEFPILHETVRECLRDVYDLPALRGLLTRIGNGSVRVHEAELEAPSPLAASLLFEYVGAFIYDDDVPLAERRAATLPLDPAMLAELIGPTDLAELLDPAVLDEVEQRLQWRSDHRRAADADGVADLLRIVGPLSTDEIAQRADGDPADWIDDLAAAGRIFALSLGPGQRWAVVEDAARLRDGLGAAVPDWIPPQLTNPVTDPLGDIVGRYARTHGPFTAHRAAARLEVPTVLADEVLARLEREGRVMRGLFRTDRDDAANASVPQWCDSEVLRTARRDSLKRARRELQPVQPSALGRFAPAWQHVGAAGGRRLAGLDGLYEVIDQLAGAVVPASALEPLVLAPRVADYSPAMLDELSSGGDVVWSGHGSVGKRDGWVALHTADSAAATLREPAAEPRDDLQRTLLTALEGGGGYFFRRLVDAATRHGDGHGEGVGDDEVAAALWDLVWSGRVTGDTLAPLRALLTAGAPSGRTAPPRRAAPRRSGRAPARPRLPTRSGPPTVAGRWALLPVSGQDATARLHDTAERLLGRHGVVVPATAASERVPGGFAGLYRVLARFEEAGLCRRGYVVDGLGGAQFAAPGAVDALRAHADRTGEDDTPPAVVLAAADPANPYGAALDWPDTEEPGPRPSRAAGALVVLVGGEPSVFVERGARSLLTFTADGRRLAAALAALSAHADVRGAESASMRIYSRAPVIERINGRPVHGHRLKPALVEAGWRPTPRGFRLGHPPPPRTRGT